MELIKEYADSLEHDRSSFLLEKTTLGEYWQIVRRIHSKNIVLRLRIEHGSVRDSETFVADITRNVGDAWKDR